MPTVQLLNVTPLTLPPSSPPYQLWSYTIDPDAGDTLTVGEVVALALPSSLDVQDPTSFPGVAALSGMFLYKDTGSSRQYAGRTISALGKQTISLVALADKAQSEVLVVTSEPGQPWTTMPFSTLDATTPAITQTLPAPVPATTTGGGTSSGGGAVADFKGTLPYASEVFGVYQPLAGWLGRNTTQRAINASTSNRRQGAVNLSFFGLDVRLARTPQLMELQKRFQGTSMAVLSPVGLVTLFREYFFEFDNFLGAPAGHLWISPGGTVEVVESSTRRTLTEKSLTQSEDTTSKVEESLTTQDDVADAVKEDNANDTKLGASASAGAKFAGIYQADASATFSNEATTKKSSELTHKHTRTQSNRVSSEIHRNYQTTFKTVTETTDTTSRRYVVQNTSTELVNYELRRKMRKVGVQVQHIGTRLSWQVFLDTPGTTLGMGELVHVVPAPELSSLRKPDAPPPLQPKDTEFTAPFTLQKYPGTKNDPHQDANYTRSGETPGVLTGMHSDDNDDHIVADFENTAPAPGAGWTISAIRQESAKTQSGDAQFLAHYDFPAGSTGKFFVRGQFLNFGGGRIITFTVAITWAPPAVDPAQVAYQAALTEYNNAVADLQRRAYASAIRDRMKLISEMRRRPAEDLRKEERQTVYGKLIQDLQLFTDEHVDSELIRQIFDVDEMLYFAAPDYWRPAPTKLPPVTKASQGKYPVPPAPTTPPADPGDPLDGGTVVSWYSHTDHDNTLDSSRNASQEWRVDYLITEETQPAPYGSSLGWLIQIDGDERRNEFLNAAWVKAVLPIRAGHETEALDWLAQANVEGEAGLGQPYPFQPGDPPNYQGRTLGQVLSLLATELEAANTDINNTLATEKVFETGFDPLESGFRPAEPYQIFDQWIEVLPTDQVVALAVKYDPKTGKLL